MEKKETIRALKFVLFSASAGIVETVAMVLCEEVIKIPGHYVCYTIALVLSVLWNFTFNRKFTFQSTANVPKAMALVFLFYVPFAPFTIWLQHLLSDVNNWNEYVVLAINMALNLLLDLAASVPVYALSCTPDERAVCALEQEMARERRAT